VKQGDMPLAVQCFGEALAPLLQRHGAVPVIMGCTEIRWPCRRQAAAPSWWTRPGYWPVRWRRTPTRISCGARMAEQANTHQKMSCNRML
jgi:hypothetical protein